MDIQSVTLRGLIGIRKGMGIDELSLDFSRMNGIVALAGDTGIGKSTVMENLHPYPQLVSRPNPVLKNHVYLRDSVKELCFLHDGKLFRTVTKIDAESGRSEGYIYVNNSNESLTNGKITEYKAWVEHEFGSTELFFNSVYCAQNSQRMSEMDPADLKRLFVEFLGRRLQSLADYEETAKSCSNILLGTLSGLQRDIDRQNEIIMEHAQASTRLEEAVQERSLFEDLQKRAADAVAIRSNELAEAKALKVQTEAAAAQLRGLKENRTELIGDISAIKAEKEITVDQIDTEIAGLAAEIEKATATLLDREAIEGAAEREKALSRKYNAMAQDRAAIEKTLAAAAKELSAAKDADAAAYKAHAEQLEKVRAKYREASDARKEINRQIEDLDRQIVETKKDPGLKQLQVDLAGFEAMAADLDRRGTISLSPTETMQCNSEDCPFIERALQAQKDIPKTQAAIDYLRRSNYEKLESFSSAKRDLKHDLVHATDSARAAKQRGERLTAAHDKAQAERSAEIERLAAQETGVRKDLDVVSERTDALRAEIEVAKQLSEKLPDIRIAEERKAMLEAQIGNRQSRLPCVKAEHDERIRALKNKVCRIQTQIDDLEANIDPDIDAKIRLIQDQIRAAEAALEISGKDLKEHQASIVRLEENVKTADQAAIELRRLVDRRKHISEHQSGWSYLQAKCGKNGLQALEINSVAPSITHDANRLLEQAFGAWAMVDIQTLDDDGKEVLRPQVIDADGDKVLVANRSGGQQVYALKALRLAMTKVSKEKSGRQYLTAYADEDDAGLDIETAKNFTKLYRAFLNEGGFNKVFFVSHKRECVELADHVVRLGKGGIQA